MTVLIVEDNTGVRRIIRRAISHFASEVYECEDGADALAAYRRYDPDLVLMDIRMPRMDGLAATRQIRSRYPTARIVMVTDYDDDALRLASSQAGASGYALKQNLTELERIITEDSAAPSKE
jgi:DNA-binding NarL/FixJ family response regulator